jgi:hypothetical protein
MSDRLLKNAHLLRWNVRALIAAYLEYASLGAPRSAFWTFLSSLGESEVFNII